MERFEASFTIESKTDAYAVERLMNRVYDSLREESLTVRDGTNDSREMLDEFATVRDAARKRMPGELTIVFQQADEGFDD